VIATIPEMDEGTDPGQVQTIVKLLERRRELEEAARQRGVRVISLEDFLRYIGFKPKQGGVRRSGTSRPYSGDKAPKSKTFSGSSGSESPFRK
jgi:hypothetical protein